MKNLLLLIIGPSNLQYSSGSSLSSVAGFFSFSLIVKLFRTLALSYTCTHYSSPSVCSFICAGIDDALNKLKLEEAKLKLEEAKGRIRKENALADEAEGKRKMIHAKLAKADSFPLRMKSSDSEVPSGEDQNTNVQQGFEVIKNLEKKKSNRYLARLNRHIHNTWKVNEPGVISASFANDYRKAYFAALKCESLENFRETVNDYDDTNDISPTDS